MGKLLSRLGNRKATRLTARQPDPFAAFARFEEAKRSTLGLEDLAEGVLRTCLSATGFTKGLILLGTEMRIGSSQGLDEAEMEMLPELVLDAIGSRLPRVGDWNGIPAWCGAFYEGDELVGILIMARQNPVGSTLAGRLETLLSLVGLVLSQRLLQLRLAEKESRLTELGALYEDARQRALTDGLTGLINHAHFKELLGLEFARSKRYGNQLTILLIDIDHFKRVNDTYGHLTGDVVLRRVAQSLKLQVRDCDIVARYGGEEMIIMLPQTDARGALVVAERIRQYIRDMVFMTEHRDPIPSITVSIGISHMRKNDTPTSLIERADQALYEAKHRGRNTVCCEGVEENALPDVMEQAQVQRKAFLAAIAEMATEVALKDHYRHDYADQLTDLARRLGEKVGLAPHQQRDLIMAASLHHIGKIALPTDLLSKSDALSDTEWKLVKAHPMLSSQLIGQIAGMGSVSEAILYHHERWDGSGYPYGLKGEQIPLVSRVLAVIDAYLAMINDRPYRKAMDPLDAFSAIAEGRGTQFDPGIVDAFRHLLECDSKAS